MRKLDIWILAAQNVRASGIKSFLCALAVCVAICSACLIGGLGQAAEQAITSEIDKAGLGGIALYSSEKDYFFETQQASAVKSSSASIKAAMPLAVQYGSIGMRNRSETAASGIIGANEDLPDVFNLELLYGRMLQANDVSNSSNVIVIEKTVAQKLYQRDNIIGKKLLVSIGSSSDYFEVVGVIEPQTEGLGYLTGGKIPNIAYVPYTSLDLLVGEKTTDMLAISCFADVSLDESAGEAARYLALSEPGIGFEYENLNGYTNTFKQIVKIITIFIAAVASIGVVVGGLGVMNSMVSSVEQRTREIGIYMALGATSGNILRCFLYESVIVCLLGGLAGGIISMGVFAIIHALLPELIHPIQGVAISIIGAVACGVLFGILPAYKACRLNPIDAIRFD